MKLEQQDKEQVQSPLVIFQDIPTSLKMLLLSVAKQVNPLKELALLPLVILRSEQQDKEQVQSPLVIFQDIPTSLKMLLLSVAKQVNPLKELALLPLVIL